MSKWCNVIVACLFTLGTNAQSCDTLVISTADNEFCQKERSIARTFAGKQHVLAEMWVDKVGEYVYFNMLLKDSATGKILNKSYGDNLINFTFIGGKAISYSYVESNMKPVISIPLNKPPDITVKIVYMVNDSSHRLTDYRLFLDAVYLDTLQYVSFIKVDREASDGLVWFKEVLYLNFREREAIRLRESVLCIFKAIQ